MKGHELIEAIEKGLFEDGTIFEVYLIDTRFPDDSMLYLTTTIKLNKGQLNWEPGTFDTSYLTCGLYKFLAKEREVEIPKKLEPILVNSESYVVAKTAERYFEKINEIIDYLKYLKERDEDR